jgi:cytidine deaminase
VAISEVVLDDLKRRAREAAAHAYAPYSGFAVGAAVLTDGGEIHSSANVENASFGLSNCAERNAIFEAVAHGARKLEALAVYTPTAAATMPCGACRQVLRSSAPRRSSSAAPTTTRASGGSRLPSCCRPRSDRQVCDLA